MFSSVSGINLVFWIWKSSNLNVSVQVQKNIITQKNKNQNKKTMINSTIILSDDVQFCMIPSKFTKCTMHDYENPPVQAFFI